ncbi:MAG: Gfo/Idh/MocA family oxidoreductase [Oscillospiraceae bacterium]|nr:Gfo/Idh/MocA family oxidoreductase [Oscillospiraceae bacterium]
MKIGIIGCGNMGQLHGTLINQNEAFKLTAVHDVVTDRGKLAAEKLGASFITDRDAFYDEVDMVFITVPNTFHAQLAIEALEHGKDVFVEKPLATNLEDAKKIRMVYKKTKNKMFIGYNRRFAPVYNMAHSIISQSKFKPVNINLIQNDGDMLDPPWLTDIALTGGFMYDTTVHFLDLACFLLGDIVRLWALSKKACYPIIDDFVVMLQFVCGAVGVISTCGHASWISPFERVQVVGDHQSIITEELDTLTHSPALGAVIDGHCFEKLPHEQKWGYKQMHEHMHEVLFEGKTAINGFSEGYKAVELIEACYESSAKGGAPVSFH